MLYEIAFSRQSRHGLPDTDGDSIRLTKEQYHTLPELSLETFDGQCKFVPKEFSEQVRHPEKSFPAIWISNDTWKVAPLDNTSDWYVHDNFYWVFVCIDVAADLWIAFTYHDAVTADDAYCSTVNVCYPTHGELYRLDEGCKELVRRFY
jgi:hypothetical protein